MRRSASRALVTWSIVALMTIAVQWVASADDLRVYFVDSVPRGADVWLDGILLEDRTPLVARLVSAGDHTIEIRKPTFETQIVHTVLGASSVTSIVADLTPLGISVNFPRERSATVGGNSVSAGERVLHLSESSVSISREGDTLFVDPSPRLRRFTDGLNIAIPIALAVAGLVTYDAIVRTPTDAPGLPPSVIALHSTVGALVGLDVALHTVMWRRLRDFSVASDVRDDPERERALLRTADDLLDRGLLEDAVIAYRTLIAEFPMSPHVPAALHRQAGVMYLLGDETEAERLYGLIIREHPVPEFYDTSLKNLADLALRRGEVETALRHLTEITYYESPYTRIEISEYAHRVAAEWLSVEPSAWIRVDRLLATFRGPVARNSPPVLTVPAE